MDNSSTDTIASTTPPPPDVFTPNIVGLFGLPGTGKTYFLEQLKKVPSLAEKNILFYEDSELIEKVVEGGLEVFEKMTLVEQATARERAMEFISRECVDKKVNAFLTGHLLFWEDDKAQEPTNVGVEKYWETYTHIMYLNVDCDNLLKRWNDDEERDRGERYWHHIEKWTETERNLLREICYQRGILFHCMGEWEGEMESTGLWRINELLEEFLHHDPEGRNALAVRDEVDSFITEQHDAINTVFVLDGDKILAPQHSGELYWDFEFGNDPITSPGGIFRNQGYSFNAFRQVVLWHEEETYDFNEFHPKVAKNVVLYPEMKALLERIACEPRFCAVIVTCGIGQIWEKVLIDNDLSHVKVIGGGRLHNGYVVTSKVKGDVVDQLHNKKLRVLAFGESPLDIPMLCKADEAYVVVGKEESRSKGMDEELSNAITENGLSALQIVFPESAPHRLDLDTLPKVSLDSNEILSIFQRKSFKHVTHHNAAKLLMTTAQNANNNGPALRQAHENIGYYLATSLLSSVLGLEEIGIQYETDGYRIRYEKYTLIVPLMPDGEPMAFGVSKALPLAGFVHARTFSDIDPGNLIGKRTIILVGTVINTGNSIVEFVVPLREQLPRVRVVLVTGVVQAGAMKEGDLADMLRCDANLSVVALRKSK